MTATAARSKRRATFHSLTVERVRPLTDDSIEVTFLVPESLREKYHYAAGQYLGLRTTLAGEEIRRSYSICRPPHDGRISVAIKRDLGGRFSNWANDHLQAGAEIDVMTPQGAFTSNLAELDGKHVVGVAAGSGITPVIAIAHTVLAASPTARFDLLFSNRSSLDVMFLEELSDLKDAFPHRFGLHHVLSREQRAAPLLSGRLDEEKLRTIFTSVLPTARVDEWVLCGPFELVQLCRDLLTEFGVDPRAVRFELFTTGEPGAVPVRPRDVRLTRGEPTYTIDLTLDGTSVSVESPRSANETVLNAALRVRPDAPFACAGGVCGTCRARVLQGSVHMQENYALEPEEIEAGYILTCQSRPTSERIVLDYDA